MDIFEEIIAVNNAGTPAVLAVRSGTEIEGLKSTMGNRWAQWLL